MATVTLKDLMDPLSKIAAATESTAEKIDALIAVSAGASGNRDAATFALLTSSKNQENTLKRIEGLLAAKLSVQIEEAEETKGFTFRQIRAAAVQRVFGNKQLRTLQDISKNTSAKQEKEKPSSKDKGGKGIKGDGATALKDLGMGALLTGKGMMLWLLVPKKAVNKFLDFVIRSFEKFEKFKAKKVKKGVDVLEAMGGAILKFSKALALSALLIIPGLIALPFLSLAIVTMGAIISTLGTKKRAQQINKGARALDRIGDGIRSFAIGLATAGLVMYALLMNPILIPAMIVSIVTFSGIVSLLGSRRRSRSIRRGARTLRLLGISLVAFGVGLALFAAASLIVLSNPASLLVMAGSIILIGRATAMIGSRRRAKRIRRGAFSLVLLGVALAVFSFGYADFAKATKDVGIGDVLIQGAAILAIGVAAALVGKFGITNILFGAAALAVNGIGLLIFNEGYVPFAKATKNLGIGDIFVQSGILLGIGLVSALVGLAVAATAGAAFLGPALFAAAGGSLLLLAPGLKAMKDLDFSADDAKDLSFTLGAVSMAFAGVEKGAGFFANVGNVFARVAQSGAGLDAAQLYEAAGDSLVKLSAGLGAFQKLNFTEDDSKELAIALTSISAAFSSAGGEPSSPGGVLGFLVGNAFAPNAVERGIDSVMGAGDALIDIVKGLGSFLDLKEKYGLTAESFEEGGFLNTSIKQTLGFVSSAFSAIGKDEVSDSWGIFSWDENNVAKGIKAVRGAGAELTQIAEGLSSFQDLVDRKVDFPKLGASISTTLTMLGDAFAILGGKEETDTNGFWSTFGISWDENLVSKGVDAVKGAGAELTQIAKGLAEFQKLIDAEVDFPTLGDAISKSLTFVGDAFAAIGGKEVEDTNAIASFFGISWDENLVEKGVDAVKGAGAELTQIAKGLSEFQKLVDAEVNFPKLGDAISKSLTFVGDAFAAVGGKEVTDDSFFGLISWDENLVQKGIDAVKGAGKELTEIATGLSKFNEIKEPTKIAANISLLLTSIGTTFTKFYEDPERKNHLDHFQGFITELSERAVDGDLDKAAEGMAAIADAVNSIDTFKAESFANLFKGAGDLTTNAEAYQALADAVGEIRDLLAGGTQTAGPGPVTEGTSITPAAGGDNNTNAQFTKINQTLARLNSTMSSLPGAIQSIKIVIPD